MAQRVILGEEDSGRFSTGGGAIGTFRSRGGGKHLGREQTRRADVHGEPRADQRAAGSGEELPDFARLAA